MTSPRSAMILLAVLVVLHGCSRRELTGPPALRLGRDECAACGMIVAEDRFSGALLIVRDGMREHALFDDIGCMLDFERDIPANVQVVERFVHDSLSRSWVDCRSAVFLFADRQAVHTPMGSGIIAFADESAADQARTQFPGDIMDYAGAASARVRWVRARPSGPAIGP